MQMEMRTLNFKLSDDLKDHLESRLRSSLGRIADQIDRLRISISDVNGPRGGIDKRCLVAVALIPRGEIMVESSGSNPVAVIADTVKRTKLAVIRTLKRQRSRKSRP